MGFIEVVRFILPASSAPAFLKLRQQAASAAGVRAQYHGYVHLQQGTNREKRRKDEMCWVLHWQKSDSDASRAGGPFASQILELAGGDATSLLFDLPDADVPELVRGLQAPVTEFAIICLKPEAPRGQADLERSMHKTFTDCYLADAAGGFVGGQWAYALNTNDVDGVAVDTASAGATPIPEMQRRLACYFLGFQSVAHHDAYAATPLFDEEIDKLAPWFGPGTGAWYVTFEKQI